jgi:hypothetical protein
VRLDDGRVLVLGGAGISEAVYDTVPSNAELYDPATGTFSPTGTMIHGTPEGQAGVLLPDGRVVVLHGEFEVPPEIYDPATGTFELVGTMATGPANRAFLLRDGRVLYYFHHDHGGRVWGCRIGIVEPSTGRSTTSHCDLTDPLVSPLSDGRFLVLERYGNATQPAARIFDPLTGTFSLDVGQPQVMALAAAPLPDGRTIVVGPGAAESFDPSTGEFAPAGRPALASESTWVSDTRALPDGRVLIYHSMHQGESPPPASLEVYDPVSDTFTALWEDLPSEASLTVLSDGRVLLAGGRPDGTAAMVIKA